jgi:hypothetical protein
LISFELAQWTTTGLSRHDRVCNNRVLQSPSYHVKSIGNKGWHVKQHLSCLVATPKRDLIYLWHAVSLESSNSENQSKRVLTPFRSAKYSRRTGGGALWSGADGPRPGAGRSATWCRSPGSLPNDRTVRALGPDGPRVRKGGGRSPAAPGSYFREGPRRGGEILGVV